MKLTGLDHFFCYPFGDVIRAFRAHAGVSDPVLTAFDVILGRVDRLFWGKLGGR